MSSTETDRWEAARPSLRRGRTWGARRALLAATLYAGNAAIVLVMGFPLIWMFYSAFKTNREFFMGPFTLPSTLRWEQFAEAWVRGNMGRYFLNSVLVTSVSVLGIVALASGAGYAFARLPMRYGVHLYYPLLIGLVLPPQVVVIPLFAMLRQMKLLDTHLALILPYIGWGIPLTTFLMRSYFLTLPRELEDAARVDGASTWTTFWRVMLPGVRPALVTVTVLNAVSVWNELMFALLFLQTDRLRTLPAGLLVFYGYHSVDYRLVFAALTLATLPLLAVYAAFQRHVIEGLTVGAVG